MKKFASFCLIVFLVSGLCSAQEIPDVFARDPLRCGGRFYVYDYGHPAVLTPAPDGYRPFYISHFARHGARWCNSEYTSLHDCLSRAAREGRLTGEGRALFSRFEAYYRKVRLRKGNLTGIGKAQHAAIATHMWERFPEVFEGPTHVEAFSTESPRVIMSMWSCLSRLKELDGDLDVQADASAAYAPWLQPNLSSSPYYRKECFRAGEAAEKAAADFFRETAPCEEIAGRYFTDTSYLEEKLGIPLQEFATTLLSVVTDTYCQETDRGCFDDLLSPEEAYLIWKGASAAFLLHFGRYEGSECLATDYAGFTLGQMIESAEADIASGGTRLRLRFGHDGGVAPLLALMDVNGFGRTVTSFSQAGDVFPDYNIPMGCSLQLVFFRNGDGDILVKPLLNEAEATLPFPPVSGPYYGWEDFKSYYLPLVREARRRVLTKNNIADESE